MDRLEGYFAGTARPPEEVTGVLGRLPRRPAPRAEYLLERGADLNWVPPGSR